MLPMSDLASYLDIPIFSWVSNMPELDDKAVKNTLVRAVAAISSLSDILLFFCTKMGWYHLAMISTSDEKSVSMAGFYRSKLKLNEKFYLTRDFNSIDKNVSEEKIRQMFRDIKREARGRLWKHVPREDECN
ncbi:guanylate cyclase receptor-type gcy-1 [Elysia marginata]|uniref:Guanylate cyclase receptor-type gcy-1 n=1 Tax=Elysia marginata TaxID=1093978 RepID=A0AAV4HIF0_9GAST|nr:guanylate cyclase receptor-type gcy-1 [Elysia marginata]